MKAAGNTTGIGEQLYMNDSGQCGTIFLKCQLSWVDKAVKELLVSNGAI